MIRLLRLGCVITFCFLFANVVGTFSRPLYGTEYTFSTIIDNTGELNFNTLGNGFRTINDSGEVVFRAGTLLDHFIYKGSGGPLTRIASSSVYFGVNTDSNGSIDDAGRVVFKATPQAFSDGIYRGNGVSGGDTQIAFSFSNPSVEQPTRSFSTASTSPSGIVAFRGARRDFPDQDPNETNTGYYLVTGAGTITALAETGGTYSSSGGTAPVVNDAGQVAFTMRTELSSSDILRYDNGSLTTVATGFSGGTEIWMNAAGDVIYADALAVKLYSGGVTTTIADTDDGFDFLQKPGNSDAFINDSGEVAFWGAVSEFNGEEVTWDGIYTGPDILEDRVVRFGDTVLGHVVNGVEALGLNNAGQILFSVVAQHPDPWVALVVATPVPEPSADFDVDGDVDGRDFLTWQRGYGLDEQQDNSLGDADFDGAVDEEDLAIWQSQYTGIGALAASVAVPEPTPGLLAVLALTAISRWRGML